MEENKKKGKSILSFLVVIVLMVAVGGAGVYAVMKVYKTKVAERLNTPKGKFEQAVVNSFKTYESPYEKFFGVKKLEKNYNKKGGSTEATVVCNELLESDAFENVEIYLRQDKSKKDKEASASGKITNNGDTILSAEAYTDNKEVNVALEEIYYGIVTFDNKDIIGQFLDSPIYKSFEDEMEEGVDEYLSSMEQVDIDIFPEVVPIDEIQITDIVNVSLWEKVEVEDKGQQEIEFDGEEVKLKEYDIVLEESIVEDFILNNLNEKMEEYLKSISDELSSKEVQEEMEEFEKYVKEAIDKDIVIKTYIKDDKIARVSYEDTRKIEGKDVEFGFVVDLLGEDNLFTDVEAGIYAKTEGNELKFEFSNKEDVKDDGFETEKNAKISVMGFTVIEYECKEKYDADDNTFEATEEIQPSSFFYMASGDSANLDAYKFTSEFKGNVEGEKGHSMSVSGDLNVKGFNINLLDITCEINISDESNVKKIDTNGGELKIFEADEDEYQEFIKEYSKDYEKVQNKLSDLFEDFYKDIEKSDWYNELNNTYDGEEF